MSMASSKMSRKTISTNTADTFQGIPEEMIIQILSDKIDQTDKMILDSLDSIFLPNVQIALKCFLKAAKDLTCIYFVFFTCTLEEHTTLVNEEELVNAAKEENRKQALHKKLLELDDYSSLTEEEREILMGIMEQKRRRSDEKRAELRGRIQDDLTINGRLQKVNSLKMFWAELDNSYLRGQAYSKLPSKSLKLPESHTHSMTLLTKDSKETKDSKSNKEKTSKKERRKDSPPVDDTAFYFYQFDIMLSEMLFLLENWNRKELMMEKSFPNFASLMASNRKDAKYTSKEFLKKTTGMRSKSLGAISMGIPENIDENENVVNTSFDPDVGYPAWLINQAHKKRSLNVIDPIIGLLKKMFTINCLTPTRRVCKETEVMYTVLSKPLPRKAKEKLDVFDLIKCEPRGESLRTEAPTPLQANDDEPQNSKSSNTTLNVPSRRKAKRRKLTLTPTASDIEQISNIPVRFLLEPGYIQEITALFKPLYSGFFKYSYFFEVVGTYYKEKIVVQASCDYPKIDTSPYTLFPHHVQTIDSKTMFLNGVYVESQQILDFGTILLIPQHLLELRSSVSMLNISGMQCYISISFRTDSNVFFCDDDQMIIEIKPGRQHVLPIYAKPPAEGLFRETLLITIRDNPRVQEINLSCFACPLKFEVTPKTVNFNKVILGKTESEKIKLRNYTAVMVYFEFEIDITSEFRISIFNGYLDPCSSSEVTITFVPENIGDKKESLVLKIFDKEKQFPEPIQTEVLTLLAEVATFPLEYATSIDLGLVKGKISHFFPFTINNLGKYDVKILLTKPNQQSDNFMLGDYFKMKHMEYVVEGEKKYSNNCRFTCDKEMTFVDTPVVHVTILDNYRNSAIDHFTFKASARVTLSKFELCPHGEYFFGYQNINTRRDSSLSLKNIGSFEFKYTIMTPKMIEEQALRKLSKNDVEQTEENERESSIPSLTDSVSQHEMKKSVLKSTPESRKKGKLKSKSRSGTDLLSEVVAGIFTISPSTAIVQPGEAVSITITCHPTECQKYKETIIFFVSEPSYEDRKGRRLNLHVEGSEPRINFQDYRSMFPLQHVVKNIEDLPYIGDNFVFETSKKVLHFGKVSLHDSLSTKFRLWNTGHVTGTVFFDVVDKDCGFSIQSRVIDITPYNFEFNVIEFAPKAIGLWRGTLEMKCQDLSKSYEISCSINLIGEACMPTIEISEPDCSVNGESAPICFGPIPVHSSCERSVVLRNIGHVPCKVLAEIVGDPRWFLSLSMSTESGGDEQDFENHGMKHSDVVALKVGEKGYVKIKFEAKSATGSDCTLNLIVMNNCFDMWKLPLNTFAFLAPVCLEDLPVHPLTNKRIAYSLNFGAVSKNELYKIRFKVKNMSDCIYKFVFGQIPELTFSPSVGHLYEGSEKTIIAAFRTKRHIDIKAKEILLTITEINLHPGHVFPLPWDDRQNPNIASLKSPSGDDSNENSGILSPINVVYESNEPPFDIIEVATVISLVVDAQCDYADYFCETREINFPPTNIQTMSSKSICIENRSNANLEVNWSITNYLDLLEKPTIPKPSLFEKLQISESEIPKLGVGEMEVFSIEPEEYTIPPQTKYDFKISFVPLDHKEHEYFLKANMKNLDPATTDLEIVVKGQSLNFPYLLNSPFMEDFDESDCRFKTYCGLFRGAETKILKFLSLGVGSECNRTVFITNNIHNPFSFVWKKIRTDSSKESFFHCEFSKGHLKPGKTTMTNFVFIPQKHGLFTDCFLFEPDEPYMPRSSLLLQGVCREPRVFFEQASLVVGVTLMNNVVEKEIILRNDEEMKIHFSFKKNSLYSDNQQLLNICPMTGLMESKSENKLRVTVRANKEGETIFSPNCVVQYMRETINFNLLMNVVDVSSRLIYFARELKKVEVKPKIPLTINLGVIIPHKLEEIKFELQNTSKVGFYYSWITEDKQSKIKTRFSREKGYLCSSENIYFTVTIVALRKCLIRNISLKLKILYGPTYVFKIEGSTQKPKFTFSFMKYDFGKCLIQTEPTKFYRTPLIFTNNNEWPVVFHWYLEKASSYVSFVGGDGYSPPNSKVATNIIFKPGHVQCIFKFKAYCQIENYKKRLELILTGGSMKLPPPSGTLELITPVREFCVGDIEFKNDTKETWETEPVITGSYFYGSTAFTVPKESIATYRISFNPMKMSPSQHKGTVFFPHPHGMNRLYALEGTVLPPKPIAEFNREICCKTYHSEILKVENWLGLRQHFKVIPEVLEGNTTMMIYKITSNDHIEVPPYGKRDFKWTIYVVNEGRLSFKVTFLNENTREFLYYIITLKILPLEVNIENIEFVTCVRVPAIKEIIVNNPLPEAVDYAVTTSSPYVMVESSFFVLPYEKYCLKVKYMPVKIESSTALLTISNSTVGNYTYNLILEAQAPNSEPEVKFRTQLGQSEVKNIYVPRVLQNSELVAEIKENASFEVGKIQSQSDKPYIEVIFLPSDIGTTRAALLVSSVVGDYTYPLFGECMYPEPQGPFIVHLGESISFEIYNPFEDTRTFKFTVDNSVFQVKPPEESIRPKKSTKITVLTSEKRLSKIGSGTLLSALGKGGQLNAKLTVSCENDLKWIYYLQCNSSNK